MNKASFIGGLLLLAAAGAARADKLLDVDPVQQETPVWCWVAVSEMVLRHYDVPDVNPASDYQCGFIGILSIATNVQACNLNCRLCNFPAGNASVLSHAIEEYPKRVAAATRSRQPRLRVTHLGTVSFDRIKDEIDNDRPLVIGVSPSGPFIPGMSAHVAVIRGYRDQNGKTEVLINDPFPFEKADFPNPYLTRARGEEEEDLSYWVRYERLRPALGWQETLLIRKVGTIRPDPIPVATMCVVNVLGNGCPMAVAVPKGTSCNCGGIPGVAY